ncbi:AMP-dependent synthetase/ligase [Arabidopsis thaliana x Arabidopsis arenosa]|uniref:AMP-dependent synthetase/ligase n=1 Tax=Arabidopsis thaliana x Arabidopsis arenosa TaxID=1240361 RepID=A0A8T2C2E4_9BRAS|nr:AMP-dependent synthetase/ligase [Arabidopsis thaliana x Arabidopsis arenosa]
MANHSRPHICQCLTRLASVKRNAVVTVYGNRIRTGREFVDGVLSLAAGLIRLGLHNGDVVSIAALNSDLFLEWLLAIALVGGIVAPLNYRWSLKEAKMAMLLVEPVLLVTDETCVSWCIHVQNGDIPSLKWRVLMESTSTDFANDDNQFLTTEMLKQHTLVPSLPTYAWAPDDAVVICFTSGTTGRPKGVTISHLAFITQSLAKIAIVGYGEDDVYLHTSPLVHIGGLSSAMAMLMVGACHVLLPKFDAKTALQVMEQNRITCFITVPAMMADLIRVNRTTKNGAENRGVRKILNGGGSLSTELLKEAVKIFPCAKILSAYGMTEACSSLTFMTLHDPTQESFKVTYPLVNQPKQGTCVGKPAPHIELMIKLDENSSRVGKILTRGPHTMLGYWGHQLVQENVASSESRSNEAWLDTGDIGTFDEFGNLCLIGRSNGRIKTGGENVYPEEVEAVLVEHPGIVSAVVVGVIDARLGEMVVACVRLQEKWIWSDVENRKRSFQLSSETLKHHCRTQNLTGFKIPKRFVRWEKQFPLTTTRKVKRDEVRRQVMSHFQILTSSL